MMLAAIGPALTAAQWGLAILSLALLLATYRVVAGPSLADRVLALEMIGIVLVGLFTLQAIGSGAAELLRVAIVLALINFLGTVAFATHIRRSIKS